MALLCEFCGHMADGTWKAVGCCRKCGYTEAASLVARAFVGVAQVKDMRPVLEALLRDFEKSFWGEIEVVMAEQNTEEATQGNTKFTQEILMAGQSKNGGWSRLQLNVLGVKWPAARGWMRKLIGKPMPDETIKKFLLLKDAHLTHVPGEYGVRECSYCGFTGSRKKFYKTSTICLECFVSTDQ